MIIGPIASLACTIQAKKGIYALLLGSGISRSSGILTGWEITLDLVSKLARIQGEDKLDDPYKWYKDKYSKEPNYSELLDSLAKTAAERNQLLRKYFEVNEDEDEKLKQPTKAHYAIARLIRNGYFKVIITTNFDRLLEIALQKNGIIPNVISNIDQLKGSMPLIHSRCTIVKVHGDYMDTRIRNTNQELEKYEDLMNTYIDRIIDEFGLIICGWSGEWDIALRACLERCSNRRFSTYWLRKGELSSKAKEIIQIRSAEVLEIKDADDFFTSLEEKVNALDEMELKQHPMSLNLICEVIKRMILDEKNVIRVRDITINEVKYIKEQINTLDWKIAPNDSNIKGRIVLLENITEKLLHIITLGCYWGAVQYNSIWEDVVKALTWKKDGLFYTAWGGMHYYPALLVMNAIVMSSIASNKYDLLFTITNKLKKKNTNRYDKNTPISLCIYPNKVIEKDICNKYFYDGERYHTPVSERLYHILKKPLSMIIVNEYELEYIFDKSEYFYSLNYWHIKSKKEDRSWAPLGRFWYKAHGGMDILDEYLKDEMEQCEEWDALLAGFFDGSLEQFNKVRSEFNSFICRVPCY